MLGGTGAMGVPLINLLAPFHEVYVTSRVARTSKMLTLHYLQGDALENQFLDQILKQYGPFDAIVDFMAYSTQALETRLSQLLSGAKQYVYLSSSRVYANSEQPLAEDSPRLLDVSTDQEFLKTEEYALEKARQENLLRSSGTHHWTIIRPYITYNTERLQLGVFEKESWLFRAIRGRTLLFPKDMAEKYTTLTFGGDVAWGISHLIGNPRALGETVHITAPKAVRWGEILEIYRDTLQKILDIRPAVHWTDSSERIKNVKKDYDAVRYDRLYDRRFDNQKFYSLCGPYEFVAPEVGLSQCLEQFLREKRTFQKLHWKYEAYVDRITDEETPFDEIPTSEARQRYLANRW